MENASKALLIAGAILLAILIISLGIMVYRNASASVDTNALDEVAVQSFNQKFQQYAGNNVRGANVNALMSTIVQNNLANQGDASKQVSLTVTSNSWTGDKANNEKITSPKGSAQTGKSYNVTCSTNSKSGYIETITVTD